VLVMRVPAVLPFVVLLVLCWKRVHLSHRVRVT
jgi:hypothetical protein